MAVHSQKTTGIGRRNGPNRHGRRPPTVARFGSSVKLFGVVLVGLAIIAAGGWWLFGIISPIDDGHDRGGNRPQEAPEKLDRSRMIRDQDLAKARLQLMGPASGYIGAWERLASVDQSYRNRMDVYRSERDYVDGIAGNLGSLGVDVPSPQSPNFPVEEINNARVGLESSMREYEIARAVYKEEAKRIQLTFEKEISSLMLNTNGEEYSPPPADTTLERIVGKAESLLRQQRGLVADFLWGFGSR